MNWKNDDLEEKIRKGVVSGLLGFDEILDQLYNNKQHNNYPPYNLEKINNNEWFLTLALAGFQLENLSLSIQGNKLIITGKKPEEKQKEYMYKGIAQRNFIKSFVVSEDVKVKNAEFNNGLLEIHLIKPECSDQIITIPIKKTSGENTPVKLINSQNLIS